MAEPQTRRVRVALNGVTRDLDVPADETLLETVRERLGASSVRYSCGIGVCGSCTVLVDGEPVSSCLLLTAMVEGRQVTSAEGLPDAAGSALRAFAEAGAYQCSYCIPAMALTVHAALADQRRPTEHGLCEQLSGNLCRCGSYPQVREALRRLVADRWSQLDSAEEASR